MKRRAFLKMLGIAPVALPATVKALGAAKPLPPNPLLDDMLAAAAQMERNFGAPQILVVHPKQWAALVALGMENAGGAKLESVPIPVLVDDFCPQDRAYFLPKTDLSAFFPEVSDGR